jgi:hypothetical protein
LWCRSDVEVLEFFFWEESCFYASKFFQSLLFFYLFFLFYGKKQVYFWWSKYGKRCVLAVERTAAKYGRNMSLSRCCFSYGRNAQLDFLEKSCVSVLFFHCMASVSVCTSLERIRCVHFLPRKNTRMGSLGSRVFTWLLPIFLIVSMLSLLPGHA